MIACKYRSLSATAVRKAESHLSLACEIMAQLVATHGSCQLANRNFRPFYTLATSIISQQLSAKAADTIEKRVLKEVPTFCPSGFLAVPFDVQLVIKSGGAGGENAVGKTKNSSYVKVIYSAS